MSGLLTVDAELGLGDWSGNRDYIGLGSSWVHDRRPGDEVFGTVVGDRDPDVRGSDEFETVDIGPDHTEDPIVFGVDKEFRHAFSDV